MDKQQLEDRKKVLEESIAIGEKMLAAVTVEDEKEAMKLELSLVRSELREVTDRLRLYFP